MICTHRPPCPPADAADHDAARLIAWHEEEGWGLLCNGVVVFTDHGEILPDLSITGAARGPARHAVAGR